MNKYIVIFLSTLLTGCGDNPFKDVTPIKDTDYAQIRIEMQRCTHISSEGSITANMRWSPKTDCLKHLKTRIVSSGEKLKVDILQ